jgi:hypothetical protein
MTAFATVFYPRFGCKYRPKKRLGRRRASPAALTSILSHLESRLLAFRDICPSVGKVWLSRQPEVDPPWMGTK